MLHIYTYISGVFLLMLLQVFHLNVCNCYTRVFKIFMVFCKCFRCTLQVLYLDVAIEDRMLHMLQWDPPLQPPAAAARMPPWVTMQLPEAGRRIRVMASIGGGR
jgi:hypothetical protein